MKINILIYFLLLFISPALAGPIHDAAVSGDLEKVKELIKSGVDVDSTTSPDSTRKIRTPLFFAIQGDNENFKGNDNSLIVEFLISSGADVNKIYGEGFTYLHQAAGGQYGPKSGRITQLLIASGAKVQVKNDYGHTPTDYALIHDNTDALQLLLTNGGVLTRKPYNLPTIKEAINEMGNFELFKFWFDRGKGYLVDDVTEFPIDINYRDPEGNSLLHLTTNIDRKLTGGDREQAFLYARQYLIAKNLVLNGAKLNAVDNLGYTPLQRAVQNNRPRLVKLLFENGADFTIKNKLGRTALELAIAFEIKEMEILIRELTKNNLSDNRYVELNAYTGHLAFELVVKIENIGKSHDIEYSTDNQNWKTLDSIIPTSKSTVYLDKSGDGETRRFYRVKLQD